MLLVNFDKLLIKTEIDQQLANQIFPICRALGLCLFAGFTSMCCE